MTHFITKKMSIMSTIKEVSALPTPSSITFFWNMGSLLGLSLVIQLVSGLILSIHYCSSTQMAFSSVIHIIRDTNYGWAFKILHMNGASLMFMLLFTHISRNMYMYSFNLKSVWSSGMLILVTSMGTAFVGYVLPWGQMSFWGATVITNLVTAIPIYGPLLVNWVWGGFSVSAPTLNRFFSFHFLLPFLMTALIIMHLIFLHKTGSKNPLGSNSNLDKLPFHPLFTWKDLLGVVWLTFVFLFLSNSNPLLICDSENFIPANPLVTPAHIQPEWYFLFAYTILRSITNKLGGVMGLLSSISIFALIPFITKPCQGAARFFTLVKKNLWTFLGTILLLTWLGAKIVEPPFIMMSKLTTIMFFLIYSNLIFLMNYKTPDYQ